MTGADGDAGAAHALGRSAVVAFGQTSDEGVVAGPVAAGAGACAMPGRPSPELLRRILQNIELRAPSLICYLLLVSLPPLFVIYLELNRHGISRKRENADSPTLDSGSWLHKIRAVI